MAEVLLARLSGPSGFERVVVLKRILPHLAGLSSFVQMFLDEARIIARIHHPNVVDVYELGTETGELFMVMEYLAGESISSVLKRLVSRNETMPPRLAAFVVAEACAGLHAAHELSDDEKNPLGVVHRDVSPQNVFVTFDGAVKVIDFGIAKAADRIARTEAGDVKGKLEYMSPEQCKNEALDRRTDVFALGIVLYELLARRRLFKRPSPAATVRAVLHDPIVPPSRLAPDCPASLDAVCMRALAREPGARYATALEMRRDLMAAVAAIGGDHLPEEELAALMQTALADRREQKEAMLVRIREGSNPTDMPSPEAEMNVDIPVAPTLGPSPSAARRWRWSAVAVAVLAVGGALAWARSRARIAPALAPSVAAATVAPSAAPAPIHVTVESDPGGATVLVDGVATGTTPAVLAFARGEKHAVVVQKNGYADAREDVSADVDQKIKLPLQRRAPAAHVSGPAPRKSTDEPPAKW
jgi:serine/threonine-protein kinase